MDPITGAIVFWAITAVIAYFALIKFGDLLEWFGSQSSLTTSGQITIKPFGINANGSLAFVLAEKVATGDYKVIQGVLNTHNGKSEVVTGRSMVGAIDEELDGHLKLDKESREQKQQLIFLA